MDNTTTTPDQVYILTTEDVYSDEVKGKTQPQRKYILFELWDRSHDKPNTVSYRFIKNGEETKLWHLNGEEIVPLRMFSVDQGRDTWNYAISHGWKQISKLEYDHNSLNVDSQPNEEPPKTP
jgi:hypothetical protein